MISQEVSGLLSECLLRWENYKGAANCPRLSTPGGNNPGTAIQYIKYYIQNKPGRGALSVHFYLRPVPRRRCLPLPGLLSAGHSQGV